MEEKRHVTVLEMVKEAQNWSLYAALNGLSAEVIVNRLQYIVTMALSCFGDPPDQVVMWLLASVDDYQLMPYLEEKKGQLITVGQGKRELRDIWVVPHKNEKMVYRAGFTIRQHRAELVKHILEHIPISNLGNTYVRDDVDSGHMEKTPQPTLQKTKAILFNELFSWWRDARSEELSQTWFWFILNYYCKARFDRGVVLTALKSSLVGVSRWRLEQLLLELNAKWQSLSVEEIQKLLAYAWFERVIWEERMVIKPGQTGTLLRLIKIGANLSHCQEAAFNQSVEAVTKISRWQNAHLELKSVLEGTTPYTDDHIFTGEISLSSAPGTTIEVKVLAYNFDKEDERVLKARIKEQLEQLIAEYWQVRYPEFQVQFDIVIKKR